MSITLELRGVNAGQWSLSTNCLRQVERLGSTNPEACRAIESLFGDDRTEAGSPRLGSRPDLLESVKQLVPLAKKLPGGFQVRRPPLAEGMQDIVGSGGSSGLLIDGVYYWIQCADDYWTLQSIEESREGIQPKPRYDLAEIATENMGVFRVEPKKSSRSDLLRLLREVERFLEGDPSNEIQIIWG